MNLQNICYDYWQKKVILYDNLPKTKDQYSNLQKIKWWGRQFTKNDGKTVTFIGIGIYSVLQVDFILKGACKSRN